MSASSNRNKSCVCVHDDAFECAKIRDRIQGILTYEEIEEEHRACECSCHDDEDYYEDMTAPDLAAKKLNKEQDLGSPATCKERNHNISKHFQQIRDEVEATCRCLTCGRDWQEFYRLDRTE